MCGQIGEVYDAALAPQWADCILPPPFMPRKQPSLLQEDLTKSRANQPVPTPKVKKKITCDVLVNLFSLRVLQHGRYMTNLSKKFSCKVFLTLPNALLEGLALQDLLSTF